MTEKVRSLHRGNQTIEVGYWMAVSLRKGTAPLRSYVGQVEAIDDHGIRLTLVDWLREAAAGFDFFVPWGNIESSLIATPQHDMTTFIQEAGTWQEKMNQTD
jgi:hypothetical protein